MDIFLFLLAPLAASLILTGIHAYLGVHVVELITLMKRQNVKLILVEPYFDLKTPQSVARETGGQVVVLMPSVGGNKDTGDYLRLFDYDVSQLVKAFQQTK